MTTRADIREAARESGWRVHPTGLSWKQEQTDTFTRGAKRVTVRWRYREGQGYTAGIQQVFALPDGLVRGRDKAAAALDMLTEYDEIMRWGVGAIVARPGGPRGRVTNVITGSDGREVRVSYPAPTRLDSPFTKVEEIRALDLITEAPLATQARERQMDKPVACPRCHAGPGRQNPLYEGEISFGGGGGTATGRFRCEVCRSEYGAEDLS